MFGNSKNQKAWDDRVESEALYACPATEEDFKNPLAVIDQCCWMGGDPQ